MAKPEVLAAWFSLLPEDGETWRSPMHREGWINAVRYCIEHERVYPKNYDAEIEARPDLVERLRRGDSGALVDIIEQIGGCKVASWETVAIRPPDPPQAVPFRPIAA